MSNKERLGTLVVLLPLSIFRTKEKEKGSQSLTRAGQKEKSQPTLGAQFGVGTILGIGVARGKFPIRINPRRIEVKNETIK